MVRRSVSSRSAARRSLKNGYFRALSWARVEQVMRALRARRGAPLVLNLHCVSPIPNPYSPPLTPEAFEGLVAFLSSQCHCTTFSELPVTAPAHRPVVILSFDDGCRDFIDYAMPILQRRRVRVNHNIIGQSIETGRPPWTIALCDALNAVSVRRVDALQIPGFSPRARQTNEVDKARFGTALCNFLKALPPERRNAIWPSIQPLLDETPPARRTEMMSADDLREVSAVHELGGHSYSHESMEHLDDAQFTVDFERCRSVLAGLVGPVTIYAFPNDSYRPSQLAILRERGVEHLLVGSVARTGVTDVHHRLPVYGDSPVELRLRALGVPLPRGSDGRTFPG